MNDRDGFVRPYWRAVIGAAFGFGIGTVAILSHSFWYGIVLLVLVILGGLVGVVILSGE